MKPLVDLLDDDQELCLVLERRLQAYGCEVRQFHRVEDFQKGIVERKPDLMIVDLDLGEELTGFDVIRWVREVRQLSTPLIVLSGASSERGVAHAIELGADDYLVKPPYRHFFEEVLGRHLKAENLAEVLPSDTKATKSIYAPAQMEFKLQVREVHEGGMVFDSDHLIKKGASFYVSGEGTFSFPQSSKGLMLRVVETLSRQQGAEKKYFIHTEWDESQEGGDELLRELVQKLLGEGLNE